MNPNISTSFYLSAQDISTCDKYYILYWEARYLYGSMVLNPTKIRRQNVDFKLVLHDNLTMKELGANPEQQIKLSFRRTRNSLTGYVLVSKVKNTSSPLIPYHHV